MSVLGFLAVFAGMCCALQWQWFASRGGDRLRTSPVC
jgi:hypothetical protein